MIEVIIYTRVSTTEQAEKGFSLRDQRVKLEQYCQKHSLKILKHFEDDHSAKTFERPQFLELLEFVKQNKKRVKKLLVVKWDRFSRDLTGSLNMVAQLKRLGVEILAIEQPLDDKIPENLIMQAIYLATPEVENARRSLNTRTGMRKAMQEGRWQGGAPLGYKKGRDALERPIIIKSEKAPLIVKVFKSFATGTYAIEALRKKMAKDGLKLSRTPFSCLLRNPVYCGLIKRKAFKDEPEQIFQGIHEPLISEELFNRVQQVLAQKKR